MGAPLVYTAIHAIAAELSQAGIPKTHRNSEADYLYRSIDDVLARLSPLLARHRLCILVHALERSMSELNPGKDSMTSVAVKVAYTMMSVDDGSSHVVATYGEALDDGDKATAKAMSAAYKTAMVQTFCIPIGDETDPDAKSHGRRRKLHCREPDQGWKQWVADIGDILGVCESEQAVSLVQERNREFLKALGREQPDLYCELGSAFASRREFLNAGKPKAPAGRKRAPKPRIRTRSEALENA